MQYNFGSWEDGMFNMRDNFFIPVAFIGSEISVGFVEPPNSEKRVIFFKYYF